MRGNYQLKTIVERIKRRSAASRRFYLQTMDQAAATANQHTVVGCSNLAHSLASLPREQKLGFTSEQKPPRVGIISSYNDMLSAHQPFHRFPMIIKKALAQDGVACQFAGAVPAMCDGITQGRPGMELSLLSRDTIAMSTAVALAHDVFDGVIALGTCDKIVPGLVMGLLSFGYLPVIFLPAGPMSSGLNHQRKQGVRDRFAQGQASRQELLAAETQTYHGPGTCTFYGTANTNQLLMEFMGLHLPGSTFFQAGAEIRDHLTAHGARHLGRCLKDGAEGKALHQILTEEAFVNAIVGLMASGGSTNHTLHLPAMARCAGIKLDWQDFDDISRLTPQLMRVYPNGSADVNDFHDAGGSSYLIRQLLEIDLLAEDVATICGRGLAAYTQLPYLSEGQVHWQDSVEKSQNLEVLRSAHQPFAAEGGLRQVSGPLLGRAIVKTSALAPERRFIKAAAKVFAEPSEIEQAFLQGKLDCDAVIVLPYQGPRARGMPELHKINALLGIIQDRGFQVALLTDGRLSGASAKILAAIHVCPEAAIAGGIARLRDGDMITIDAEQGTLEVHIDQDLWDSRNLPTWELTAQSGSGREWFNWMRQSLSQADEGATVHVTSHDKTANLGGKKHD